MAESSMTLIADSGVPKAVTLVGREQASNADESIILVLPRNHIKKFELRHS